VDEISLSNSSLKGMASDSELVRSREIRFRGPHPSGDQAPSAALLLNDIDGVLDSGVTAVDLISVRYTLDLVTLEVIEGLLVEFGFHLDNSLLIKLRRALHYYSEDCQRVNLGIECQEGINCNAKVLANRYRQRGPKEGLPEHWRKYL
jgi:hypothetical protein